MIKTFLTVVIAALIATGLIVSAFRGAFSHLKGDVPKPKKGDPAEGISHYLNSFFPWKNPFHDGIVPLVYFILKIIRFLLIPLSLPGKLFYFLLRNRVASVVCTILFYSIVILLLIDRLGIDLSWLIADMSSICEPSMQKGLINRH